MYSPEKPEIMLMHSKPRGKRQRITVAGIYNISQATLHLGVAKCCKKDIFSKRKGRELAIGRLGLVGNKSMIQLNVSPEADLRRLFRNKFYQIENFLENNFFHHLKDLDNTPGAELEFEPIDQKFIN